MVSGASDTCYDVAVVGGGAAGVMALLRVVLNNDQCLFFPGSSLEKKRSRAFWVSQVENVPGLLRYKKGIEDPNKETLEWIAASPFAHNLNTKKNRSVTAIDKDQQSIFHLTDDKGESYRARYVILCTGIMDVQPLIKGSIQDILPYANVQLADYCIRCDGHHTYHKKLAVIGQESSAAWVAIMCHERYKCQSVTMLTNGRSPEFAPEVQEIIRFYDIKIETAAIDDIVGDPKKKILHAVKLAGGKQIDLDIIFISLGSIIYNQLAKSLGAEVDGRGYVLGDSKGETSVPNLFVAGDLRANAKKQIYTAWDHAVDSADAINARIRKSRREQLMGKS